MNEIVPSKKRGPGQRQLVRYSPELMAVICERISLGESLRAICASTGMPSEAAVRYWVSQDHEGCKAGFEAAREVQAHRFAEELVALCDEQPPLLPDGRVDQGWVTWQKMRIDTRKWTASRILPKEYGEHVALKGDTAGGGLNIRIDLA
jgi:hypothetical protein